VALIVLLRLGGHRECLGLMTSATEGKLRLPSSVDVADYCYRLAGVDVGSVCCCAGARDVRIRLEDLDNEGIWAEVVYSSLGLRQNMLTDHSLVRAASSAINEWIKTEIQGVAPDRLVPTGVLPPLNVPDAIVELQHCADLGLRAVYLPTGVPTGVEDYNSDVWEPL